MDILTVKEILQIQDGISGTSGTSGTSGEEGTGGSGGTEHAAGTVSGSIQYVSASTFGADERLRWEGETPAILTYTGSLQAQSVPAWNVAGLDFTYTNILITSGNTIFAGGEYYDGSGSIFKSEDRGVTWTILSTLGDSVYIYAMAISASAILATAWNGAAYPDTGWFYRSVDGGFSWTSSSINGTDSSTLNCLFVTGSDIFVCDSYAAGVSKSSDGGNTWAESGNGLPPLANAIVMATFKDLILLALGEAGIYTSSNGGDSWAYSGLTGSYVRGFGITDQYAYAQDSGNLYWTYDATSWGTQTFPDNNIDSIIATGSNILIGTDNGNMWFSSDYASSWKKINSGYVTYGEPYASVFFGNDAFISDGDNGGVYHSIDLINKYNAYGMSIFADGEIETTSDMIVKTIKTHREEGNGLTEAQFGAYYPTYITSNWPSVAFNATYESWSWKFGASSNNSYASAITMNPYDGVLRLWSSHVSGNASNYIAGFDNPSLLNLYPNGQVQIPYFTQSQFIKVDSGGYLFGSNASEFATTGSNIFNGNQIIHGTVAEGNNTTASGVYSHAEGESTIASGDYTHAQGRYSVAGNDDSTAMGYGSLAGGQASLAAGYYATTGKQHFWNSYDTSSKTIIISGNVSSNFSTGNRVKVYWEGAEEDIYSVVVSSTSGEGSTFIVLASDVIGENVSSATFSWIMNLSNWAPGYANAATSLGNNTIAVGKHSLATGHYTKAESANSTVVGTFNVGGGNPIDNDGPPLQPILTDPLFEVGNGTSESDRRNAFTIFKNGNALFSGSISFATDDVTSSTANQGNVNVPSKAEAFLIINVAGKEYRVALYNV